MKLIVHTDGGARGNPGPAAVGVVIERVVSVDELLEGSGGAAKTQMLARFGKRIGETTNNVAEYRGVIEALTYLKSHPPAGRSTVHFFLDSLLVVNQLNGAFKVKNGYLRNLLLQVRLLEQEIGGDIYYHAIAREENREADVLVNHALDQSI